MRVASSPQVSAIFPEFQKHPSLLKMSIGERWVFKGIPVTKYIGHFSDGRRYAIGIGPAITFQDLEHER